MSRKQTPYAISKDGGGLFVKVSAVMHPMCALIDGLTLTYFGRGRTAYLTIDQAIEWCENEAKVNEPWAIGPIDAKARKPVSGNQILAALRAGKSLVDLPTDKLIKYSELGNVKVLLAAEQVATVMNQNFGKWLVDNALPVLVRAAPIVLPLLV